MRIIFHKMLAFLIDSSTPVEAGSEEETLDAIKLQAADELVNMQFDTSLMTLVNLHRALDVQGNDTKIGHWCVSENENDVRGMQGWSIYWLEFSGYVSPDRKAGMAFDSPLRLTLWASGKDDNTIQQAIKIWAETHFKGWSIESLKCVRR
jgi:hypothetical protein